jgi:LacI family repressor for deo operon, udp, cdd, tsx, nupC, and nupG
MARSFADSSGAAGAERSVSISQVATRAGVSVATVSRVLNGKQTVKEATRLRVAEAIQALGYRVNQMARSLRTDESRLLLVMVPDIGNPFYAQIVQGINGVVQDRGYSVLLCETGGDANRERRYFDLLESRRADGAICLDPDTVQQALSGQALRFPWVACCEFDSQVAVPYVGIDNRAAARDAVACLIDKGHRRIAFVNSDTRFMYARERSLGYADALAQADIALRADYCVSVDGLDFAAGKRAAQALIDLEQRPTAVFAVSDTLAIGVMRGLHEAGLGVPQDMSVMGFDDISLAQQTCPALSTVAQPMRTLGEQAAYLLLRQLDDPRSRISGVLLPHRVVLRESA